MRLSRIIIAAVTAAVLGLGLTALFSAGGGTTQTNSVATVEIGVTNPSVQSEITVPEVRGETGSQASQAFFALGFQAVYAANVTQPEAKAGTVLEQVPAAGSKVALDDTTIRLTIATSGAPSSVRFVPHRRG
jgi:beta-lactam-binding protein with PASTA domain